MKRLVLFGAGRGGEKALNRFGRERVAYYCDNDEYLIGKTVNGIKVLSFDDLLGKIRGKEDLCIIITPENKWNRQEIVCQLEKKGVNDYLFLNYNKEMTFIDERECFRQKKVYRRDKVIDYINESQKIDMFSEIKSFLSLKESLIDDFGKDEIITKYDYDDESNFYGNLQALTEYANISYKDEAFFPIINHNNAFPLFAPFFNDYATIVQGRYYVDAIHKYKPYIPVFSVGPYIYYASEIIKEKEKKAIKDKMGKVITIVLPHSAETLEVEYNIRAFIDKTKELFSRNYNSIWVLMYWLDVTKENIELIESMGCRPITAGFRFDPLFIRRLKSILSLSDAIVDDRLSTTSCYAISLNKKVFTFDDWDKYWKMNRPDQWDLLDEWFVKEDKRQYADESRLWMKADINYR